MAAKIGDRIISTCMSLMRYKSAVMLVAMFYFLQWLGVDFLLILDGAFSAVFCVVSVAGCWTSLSFARHRGRAGGRAEDRGRCQRWLVRRIERFLTSRTTEPEIAPAAPRPELPLGADYTVIWLHSVRRGPARPPPPPRPLTLVCLQARRACPPSC
jgi:hypothetical protein